MIYSKLLKKEASLAVIGLGYVGLPVALNFAKKIRPAFKFAAGISPNSALISSAFKKAKPVSSINDFAKVVFPDPFAPAMTMTCLLRAEMEVWFGTGNCPGSPRGHRMGICMSAGRECFSDGRGRR